MELAYGGFRVAEDNETVYPIARAAYGEDVAEIQYAFVAGDITKDAEALEAALNGIEDGSVVSIRPSGTEPKIKFYFGVHGEGCDAKVAALRKEFEN